MMTIYLISLPNDLPRRETLQKRFPHFYDRFTLIEAINGKTLSAIDYFNLAIQSLPSLGRVLSPSELGCSLSHMKALEHFIASDREKALILEDDVIGDDRDIETIMGIVSGLDDNALLICGGQDGMYHKRYLYGKRIKNTSMYELAPFSYRYVFRTCCYVVTKNAAREILKQHETCLKLADDWNGFFQDSHIKIYFADIFSHPLDLKESHIETERKSALGTKKSFFATLVRRWEHRFGKILCILSGYEKITFRSPL